MFTRPDGLSDEAVAAAVTDEWGLRVDAVEHMAVGFGSYHWRADGAGERWFVTVDDLEVPDSDMAANRTRNRCGGSASRSRPRDACATRA